MPCLRPKDNFGASAPDALRSRLGVSADMYRRLARILRRRRRDVQSDHRGKREGDWKSALGFAASIVAPIYWQRGEQGAYARETERPFSLRTPEALFGVTTAHVVDGPGGARESCAQHGQAPLRSARRTASRSNCRGMHVGVDLDLDIVIATFMISPREIEAIERVPSTACRRSGRLRHRLEPVPPAVIGRHTGDVEALDHPLAEPPRDLLPRSCQPVARPTPSAKDQAAAAAVT